MVKNAELWGGLFWLAVGGFVIRQGLALDLGVLRAPGSGFLVFWCGVLIVAFAAMIAAAAVLQREPTSLAALWPEKRWRKGLLVIVAVVLYALLLEPLGFIVCSLPLLLLLMRAVDPARWRVALPVAATATFGVWLAMTEWLKVPLPAGLVWDRFGLL